MNNEDYKKILKYAIKNCEIKILEQESLKEIYQKRYNSLERREQDELSSNIRPNR